MPCACRQLPAALRAARAGTPRRPRRRCAPASGQPVPASAADTGTCRPGADACDRL